MTVNDGSNDDDDNNDNNDDGDEAIWESLDSDAAVVLLCASARAARTKCTLHVVLWRRCPTAIGFAERVSRRLLRKRPRESWLLQNKFTRLILNASRKSKMLVVVMTSKKTTQMKIKLANETLFYTYFGACSDWLMNRSRT